jgi:hypothetical protein
MLHEELSLASAGVASTCYQKDGDLDNATVRDRRNEAVVPEACGVDDLPAGGKRTE